VRALALLDAPAGRGEDDPGGPWVDELSARLLDMRFQVQSIAGPRGPRALPRGERSGRDELRPLLGTVTPCLGRERELHLLESWLTHSLEEPIAQALLVTAPSGVGKSRLRQEFVRRIEERGTRVSIWLGRGDPMRAGTAYGILGHALRELCGIRGSRDEHDPSHEAEQRARLSERVGRNLPPMERPQVAEFLGELCGLHFPDGESARLRAAREDPRVMSDQVAAAFTAFLAAECAHKPVLLILEDLHWSDASTLRLVEAALRDLPEQPLAVLGLARPELKEMFPRLWGERNTQELRLQGLTRKASVELVQRVLGARTALEAETIDRIVMQAAGNALFLEELIRAVAEGRGDELPETVLAMLQARFERLTPMARRLVRMASLFGDSFWGRGVHALLGGDRHEQEIERALGALVDGEVLVFRGENRATGERQFAFRHSLLRDAAYGLMSEEDRRLGHRLVAAYLERSGENDPLVLAEHYRRGGRPERAAVHYSRAAQQALANSDLRGALAHVAQGAACGARGELLGTLRSSEGWAHLLLGNFSTADQAILPAFELLPAGSPGWVSLQGVAMALAGFQNQRQRLLQHLELLTTTPIWPGAEKSFLDPALMGSGFASMLGLRTTATVFLDRLREISNRLGLHEPRARGLLELSTLWYQLCLEGHAWGYCSAAQVAIECFAAAGDRYNGANGRCHTAVGLLLLGDIERGLALYREMLDSFERSGEVIMRLATQALCGFALAEVGGLHHVEHRTLAHAMAEAAASNPAIQGIWGGLAHIALVIMRIDEGRLDQAEATARQTLQLLENAPAGRPLLYALLGRILLAQDRLAEAEVAVRAGLAQLAAQGGAGLLDTKLHLTAAEVWQALGQEEAARSAFAEARRTLAHHAAQIPDAEARRRFLAHSREHARLVELGLWEGEAS
jgi:tetratricopeptide (TPR) repeat protein